MKIIDYAKKHKEEIVVASILIVMTTISFKKGFALGKESGRKKFLEELMNLTSLVIVGSSLAYFGYRKGRKTERKLCIDWLEALDVSEIK